MFYLTLPSNSSMEYYPDNKAGHYFTNLPQDIQLTDDYEVGLSEIQISNTYLNIGDGDCYLHYVSPDSETNNEADKTDPDYKGPTTTTVTVPGGLYESNEFFIHNLNQMIKNEIGQKKNGKQKIKLYYNRASKKASLTLYEHGGILRLSSSLQRILSITSPSLSGPKHFEGQFIMDLNEDFKSIYVYCDLIRARPVGDIMAPLLRIVPMSNKKDQVSHHIFEKPHYIPLSRVQFNSVEILLTTDKGKVVAFGSGSTILTLHFRRKRPDHY